MKTLSDAEMAYLASLLGIALQIVTTDGAAPSLSFPSVALPSSRDRLVELMGQAGPAGVMIGYAAGAIGKDRSTTSRHLNELVREGKARTKQIGRTKVFCLVG